MLYANSLIEDEPEPKTSDRDKNKVRLIGRTSFCVSITNTSHDYLQPLVDKLDAYNEDPSIASGSAKLAHFPPDFKPIPCKPLFFDLALNHIDMPSLEDEMTATKDGGITGFVKGLWGWKK